MVYGKTLCAAALVLSASLLAGPGQTEEKLPSVSGPANGTNVEPSAAVQKQTGSPSVISIALRQPSPVIGSVLSSGAPGVEGLPGGPSGRDARR
ncbi:MAG TPA: hypothetical protein VFF88_08145 [Methylocella sp.]|nr:hypothetical protein [Methylocella sp.]